MFVNPFIMHEKPVLLLRRRLRLLGVPVTDITINNTLQNHPDYPSLLSLSDALRSWKINNIATRLPKEQLTQLPLPIIAHTYAGGGNFALVTAVDEVGVQFFIDEKEQVQPLETFVKDWSGVALLAEKGEASGEKNYKKIPQKERRYALKFPLLLFSFLFIAAIAVFSFYHQTSLLRLSFGFALFLLVVLGKKR